MTTYDAPMCLACRHFKKLPEQGAATCRAFPEGIPDAIFWEHGDHREPWEGDNGILFEQDPEKPALEEVY